MASEYPLGVSRTDIDEAILDFDRGIDHGFANSTDYDLLLPDGRRYPLKAIAACPNCHRRLHLAFDRLQIKQILYAKIPRLLNPLPELQATDNSPASSRPAT